MPVSCHITLSLRPPCGSDPHLPQPVRACLASTDGLPEAAQPPPSVERIPLDVVVVLMSLAELFTKCFRGKNFNKILSIMKINF